MLHYLSNPEYVHVLLNPLPVYGLGLGIVALIGAFIARTPSARVIAQLLIFISAISVWPVAYYGDAAKDRVLAMADRDGEKWLDEHEARADKVIAVFYVLAAVSAVALLLEKFRPRFGPALLIITFVLALGAIAAGDYIGSAGGRIRHKEYRYVPPPERSPDHGGD